MCFFRLGDTFCPNDEQTFRSSHDTILVILFSYSSYIYWLFTFYIFICVLYYLILSC